MTRKNRKDRKKEPTGCTAQPTVMTFSEPAYVHEDDGVHCVMCGGYMWPIHDKETGLIMYYKCGDCGEKK